MEIYYFFFFAGAFFLTDLVVIFGATVLTAFFVAFLAVDLAFLTAFFAAFFTVFLAFATVLTAFFPLTVFCESFNFAISTSSFLFLFSTFL
ncbi:hypothetical protein C0585_00895 [Candidatus Woesearchaeota archaeon]|nr:MAG: hypothetical protein C0585_00895 [Candidatus Woesearchaeota archaeon]